MKTPEQIRDMEFQKSTMGGYKQSDVELFLEEVASQIEILTRQKNDAERKLQEFSKKSPDAALSASSIQNVLVSAQRVAEQVTDDAKAQAEGIIADANLKLTEAEIKSNEIIAEAEKKAVLLGETAEIEAGKIIAAAVKEAEIITAEAKESIELEQKLYDRLKIEISDFRKKASSQCSALVELINQLPGEIPFNLERSKTVLSVDFSDPQQLLKDAVDKRIASERAAKEAVVAAEPEVKPEDEPELESEAKIEKAPEVAVMPEAEPVVTADVEFAEDTQLSFGDETAAEVTAEPEIEEAKADQEEEVPFAVAEAKEDEPVKPKAHISFGDEDDDFDDEDDEPRLFFRRKKK